MIRKLVVLVMCVALFGGSIALAAGTDDSDDTPGRLDIEYLGAHVTPSGFEFEIEMFRAWRNRLFRSPSRRGFLTIYFNTGGDQKPEWKGSIEREDGRWAAHMCAQHTTDDIPCYRARVWRAERESISVLLKPEDILREGDQTYSWRVKTKLRFADGCPDGGTRFCIDRAVGKQAD